MKNGKSAPPASAKKTEVIIPIDTIDDIYSDFDMRILTIRSLSTDFINEVKMQSEHTENDEAIEIKIIAPLSIKETELTKKIQKLTKIRIKEYFDNEFFEIKYQRRTILTRSLIFITSGLACFFLFKYFSQFKFKNIWLVTLLELVTFFSWFATWSGIDRLRERRSRRELSQSRRLSECTIQFKFIKTFESVSLLEKIPV